MSWSIACIKNNVVISDEIGNALAEKFPNIPTISYFTEHEEACPGETVLDYLLEDSLLYFSTDHDEHMDWIYEDICEFLASQKVTGDICFGSLEGDNAGRFWGYRFDGKGGWKYLDGKVDWFISARK